jgi:hypothetical protein
MAIDLEYAPGATPLDPDEAGPTERRHLKFPGRIHGVSLTPMTKAKPPLEATLPRGAYLDAAAFDAECAKIFRRMLPA